MNTFENYDNGNGFFFIILFDSISIKAMECYLCLRKQKQELMRIFFLNVQIMRKS